jgi:NAD-dependent deacetylase
MNDFEYRISEFQNMLDTHNKIVFFSGAGVSTESGIPDFRSKDGLYNNKDVQFERFQPEYLLSRDCLYNKPSVFFEFYRQKLDVHDYKPNITHIKVAELENKGKMLGVVTQNIDGLHQKAGSKIVYEIHGTTSKNYCHKCGKEYPEDYIFKYDGKIPYCTECKERGIVRPAITLYGEAVPTDQFTAGLDIIENADMLIIAGTSLVVYPAAGMINHFSGDKMVIINNQATPFDSYADLIFRENLGDVWKGINI